MSLSPKQIEADMELDALDRALDAAEQCLLPLLAKLSADEVVDMFKTHCDTHLGIEMLNYACHGNKDDCQDHDLREVRP